MLVVALALPGCGYNTIQREDEAVTAAWSEVVNQYKRRADLIPNLVATVKGYAAHEQEVLENVTAARARAGSTQIGPEMLDDPAAVQRFQEAQSQVTSALSRLLVVVEKYPDLKADQSFRDLQAQLEGTENRITVARNRFIEAVQGFNTTVRQFPVNLTAKLFGYGTKASFTVEDEGAVATPPPVDFGPR
jgi:LemA protein